MVGVVGNRGLRGRFAFAGTPALSAASGPDIERTIATLTYAYVRGMFDVALQTQAISTTEISLAGRYLDGADLRGYDPVAVAVVKAVVSDLERRAVPAGMSGIGLGNLFDDVWKGIKGGATWVWNAGKAIFGAGQKSAEIESQVQQTKGRIDRIFSDVESVLANIGAAVKGGAVSTGLYGFWSSTLGKIVVIGGGLILVMSLARR